MEENPDVLKPVSRQKGAKQEQIDRGALQDSYKNMLIRLGLITNQGQSFKISALGRLLVRYIEVKNEQYEES